MPASTINGNSQRGLGAANNQRGPQNNRGYFNAENSPHCIASGNTVIPVTGIAAIYMPVALPLGMDDYVVIANGSTAAVYVNKYESLTGHFTVFVITGTVGNLASWSVFTMGYCKEVTASV